MTEGNIGEDNLIGAYCHFPVIGWTLVPIIVYLMKGKENKELGFQCKQAIVFQILTYVIAFGGGIALAVVGIMMAAALGDAGGLVMLVFWLVYPLLMLVLTVIMLYAAYKTYSKVHYEYPVIGKMLK